MGEIKRIRKRDRIRQKLKKLTERDILTAMRETLDAGYELFKRKLGDYGIDVFKASGGIGIITKIREKYARFNNLMRKTDNPNFESIRDTVQDLAWYCATLLSMIDKGVVDIGELQEQYRLVFVEEEEDIDDN